MKQTLIGSQIHIGLKHCCLQVVAKYPIEASFLNVSLCNGVKSLGTRRSSSAVTEEEPVAISEFLKLPLDDAGKERAHLQENMKTQKNIENLTIPSNGAVSARPPVKLSI